MEATGKTVWRFVLCDRFSVGYRVDEKPFGVVADENHVILG